MRGGSVPVIGRQPELGTIGSIVDDARAGFGGALVIVGDPGVGKSTLLQSAASSVPAAIVRSVVGVETESAFGYAGLHRLLLDDLDRLDELTDRDRLVLSIALGLESGEAVGVQLVGLALLSLLSTIAGTSGLIVCVDDAQWLDTESLHSLTFAARRIRAEGVAVLFAARSGSDGSSFDGLRRLDVEGLESDAAAELLRYSIDTPVSEAMAARIIQATGGNPLALVDLGRELSAMELSGAAVVHDPVPIGDRLERHYRDRLVSLDADTRTWLLLAAVDSSAETTTVDLAARALGLDPSAGDVAAAAQIVSIRSHVQFRHPLIRASVASSATPADRRRVHEALAEVAGQRGDDSRRALHLAAAATGLDDALADELERCAGDACARGAHGECAAFLTRAAELTGTRDRRADRFVAAAASAFADGSLVQANALIERCETASLAGDGAARLLLLQVRIDGRTGDRNAEPNAAAHCLEAAERFGLGTIAGRAALLAAGEHAAMAAEFSTFAGVADVARVMAGAGAADRPDPVLDGLLAGYVAVVEERWVEAVHHVHAAVDAMERGDGVTPPRDHTMLSTTLCSALWAWDRMDRLLERAADSARASGDLSELDIVLYAQSLADTNLGNLALAEQRLVEGHRLRSTIGPVADDVTTLFRHPGLLAWTGADPDFASTAAAIIDASEFIGQGAMATLTRGALALDHLSRGEYEAALSNAVRALQGDPLGVNMWVAPIAVEAAARAGDLPLAVSTVRGLSRRAEAAGTNWSLGVLARTVALADESAEAEHAYRRSIALLTPTPARGDLARSHLVYGEWLRRRRRRSDARTHLRRAHSMFVDMGAGPFAERSRIELAATGERVRDRTPAAAVVLTPQEDQVARLAADGMTNAEIASRLYISAKTVDYHLGKVYRKLGIDSRRDLRRLNLAR